MKYIFLILLSFTILLANASHENAFTKVGLQGIDTLNILISATNHIYYYDSSIAEDASNFKIVFAWDIRYLILLARDEAKKKATPLSSF